MSRPQKITTQMIEKKISAQRDLDVYRHQLETFGNENAKLLSAANAQSKVEANRKINYHNVCQKEREYEQRIYDTQKLARLQQREAEQNEALATQLDRETAENERRAREIQRILNSAPEIKELERCLKIAHLNKERAAQHMEKVARENFEKEREQAIEDKMEHDRQMSLKADEDKKNEGDAMWEETRVILQRQLKERDDMRMEAKRQVEIDRATVDSVVRKIQEEDNASYQKMKEEQRKTSAMMKAAEEQARKEKADRAAALKAEEDAIDAYNKALEARGAGEAQKKADKKAEEDRILARIVAETEAKRKAEQEFSDLRDMLWAEELEKARADDAKARQDKARNMRLEMMEANSRMMESKARQRDAEATEEARMLSLMRAKFAADEEKERREEEARKQAKIHHMTLISRQSEERKRMYDIEKANEEAFLAEAREREEYRQRVIKEARKRLLAEHAAKVAGYMPGGILKNPEDQNAYKDAVNALP